MLKFAIFGCGKISAKHIEALSKIQAAKLAAVCDSNEEKAKEYGVKLGIPFYTSYHDMLENEDIDVVNILTPSGMHSVHTIEIVKKYKKHIVCEKPMALNLKDADEMIKVCKDNNVRLFIVNQNRLNIPVQKLKQAIDEGQLGKLILGTIRMRWARHQQYYDLDQWRGTWKMDGGCLMNQACHLIDLLQWLMGRPVEVSAMTSTSLLNIEAEDVGIGIIKFEKGALGIIEATTAARPKSIEGSISILGEKGAVEIDGMLANKVRLWNVLDHSIDDSLFALEENPSDGYGHERYLRHVIDCITNDKEALVDGTEGRKTLEIINAMYESAKSGKLVKL